MLVSLASNEPSKATGDERITYIVDQGLIRFGKFVAAALAIFFLLGVYAFGVDLKGLLHEMRHAQDKIRGSEDLVRATEDRLRLSEENVIRLIRDVENAKSEVQTGKAELAELLLEAQQALVNIQTMFAQVKVDSVHAITVITEYRTKVLSSAEEIKLAEIKAKRPW